MPDLPVSLSPRQIECLRLVADLKDTQQIAHLLGLSPHTVDSYIRDAVRQLGAANRRQAAALLRDHEQASGAPEKFGYDFPRGDPANRSAAGIEAQSDGEVAGAAGMASAVREMPGAYLGGTAPGDPSGWWPLPGEVRRPSSISPLRRLVLILALMLGLGAGVGIAVLTVAGAIVVSERPRS